MLPPKTNSGAGIPEFLNWTGEEDSRIVLYVEGAVRVEKYQRVVLLSNDTDSFALLVHYAQYLQTMGVKDIWQQYGTGKSGTCFHYIRQFLNLEHRSPRQ